VVEADGFAREFPRAAARQGRDEGPDAEAFGARRDGRQCDPGVDVGTVDAVPEVVPEEEAVPSRVLGCDRQVDENGGIAEGAERGQEDAVLHLNRTCLWGGRGNGAS
jgi:hypothetical protein